MELTSSNQAQEIIENRFDIGNNHIRCHPPHCPTFERRKCHQLGHLSFHYPTNVLHHTETVDENSNTTNDLTAMQNPENNNESEIKMDTNEVNNEPEPTIEEVHETAL